MQGTLDGQAEIGTAFAGNQQERQSEPPESLGNLNLGLGLRPIEGIMTMQFPIRKSKWALLFAALFLLTACENTRSQDVGDGVASVAGAVAGQIIGFGSGSIITTALRGASRGMLTPDAEQGFGLEDRSRAEAVAERALEKSESGNTLYWRNPDNSAGGSFTPVRTVEDKHGICRDFVQSLRIDGSISTSQGRACRNPGGGWTIISLQPLAV